MAPELQRRLIDALPGKQIFIMYGATEASARLAYLDPADLPRKIGSIGKAIPGVDLRVLLKDGTEADAGEVGELVASGRNIMEGYWNDPEETAAVLDEAGYHTGDLATRDEEGFLYVVGRNREMIKSGAHRISPKEIEETLVEHPEVHEAAVIGVPDEILGESIRAFISARPDQTPLAEEIVAWCHQKLPPYKVPGSLQVIRDFRRSAAGKIDKSFLAEEYASRNAIIPSEGCSAQRVGWTLAKTWVGPSNTSHLRPNNHALQMISSSGGPPNVAGQLDLTLLERAYDGSQSPGRLAGRIARSPLGALIGMFFHRDGWLGGYDAWPRRMVRLAHISLVGTGLLNIAFAVSIKAMELELPPRLAGPLLIAGAIAMPSACLICAYRKNGWLIFVVPVACLVIATAEIVFRGVAP